MFKIYPGGVQGDEPDVLRKIRFGQLHGGAFTGYGIGHIYSPTRVLELPFLFNDIDEIEIGSGANTLLIAGPCVVEGEIVMLQAAECLR